MSDMQEMLSIFEDVVRVNRAVIRPLIEKKTGLKVVSEGENFGAIVTDADLNISRALLDGGVVPNVEGFRKRYPGSFSEEADSPKRHAALEIIELDPMDGTGDFKKTYGTLNVMPPTTLVAKLKRESTASQFVPVAGLIFEIIHEYALVAANGKLKLLTAMADGRVKDVPLKPVGFTTWMKFTNVWGHSKSKVIIANRRTSYPQNVCDEDFPQWLKNLKFNLKQIPVGGAGAQALHFFRKYVEPLNRVSSPGAKAFADLTPLDISFNCQPDWKTWDTDPTKAIASVIANEVSNGSFVPRYPRLALDIFGDPLTANAAAPTLKDMWHRKGTVLATTPNLETALTTFARKFAKETGKDLLSVNY